MIKLHGNRFSTCTRKVLCVLNEKNANWEWVDVDMGKGEHKAPAHMAFQPFGKVPALEKDDFRMTESRAMCRYLDEVLPGTKLTPTTPEGRAMMEQWISIETSEFTNNAMPLISQYVFAPMRGQTPDQAKIDELTPKLEVALDVMNKALERREWFAGTYSLADISFATYFQYLAGTPAWKSVEARKNVVAWWTRMSARPAWQKAIAGPTPTA